MMNRTTIVAALSLVAVAASHAADRQPVSIRFAPEFSGQPFACGSTHSGIGSTSSTVTVTDFRLFVSEIALLRADGLAVFVDLDQDGRWQHQNVALLDFENGQGPCANGTSATNDTVRGSVPRGEYTGLIFTVGVPFALNHADPALAPAPLNLTAMFWNWQGGYKFIKLDMSTTGRPLQTQALPAAHGSGASPAPAGWSLHLGSTVCAAASRTTPATHCANPNRMTVRFDRFNTASNVVVIDPAPVLAAANVDFNTPETSPGCMSFPNDPDCQTVLPRLGLPFGGQPALAQEMMRVR